MPARRAVAALACVICVAPLAASQTPASPAQQPAPASYSAPRTSFGQPSLEGIWTQNFVLLMEASPQAPTLTLPEPAAKAMAASVASVFIAQSERGLDPEVPELMNSTDGLAIVRGERRTRSVVEPADGKLPYTPEARTKSSRGPVSRLYDNHEERPNWERCVTSLGLPPVTGIATTSVNPRRFVQTRDHVVLHTEYGDEARIIPFTGAHRSSALHSPLGDSIARWEGDTLVIETIGLPEKDRVRFFSNLVITSDAKVIERFTRLSENELLYQYTVEDPKTYTAPWLAEYSLYRTSQRMFEHACHEGNYSLPNILRAQRVKDARPVAKADKPAASR